MNDQPRRFHSAYVKITNKIVKEVYYSGPLVPVEVSNSVRKPVWGMIQLQLQKSVKEVADEASL